MRTSSTFALAAAVMAAAALPFSSVFLPSGSRPPAVDNLVRSVPAGLLDGDIVFRTGADALSRIVLGQRPSARFSHVGVVALMGGVPHVIHSVPGDDGGRGGVRIDTLVHFISPERAVDVGYFRVAGLDPLRRADVSRHAHSKIGLPFDYGFSVSSEDVVYCTELVVKSLENAGVAIGDSLDRVSVLALGGTAIPPDSLWQSELLRELPLEEEPG